MLNLVTIWTFPYQHQLLIIRGRLEAEGIETYAQDELTIQVDPLYSNALGGIKLMVNEDDVTRANEILAESGMVMKEDKPGFEFLQAFNQFSNRLPVVGTLSQESRLFILLGLFVLLLGGAIYFLAV